ncbi:hypothetical protein BJF93_18220 [Xaviernesmea oryzae]|uniref:Nudix hydrolase domain-containing protein n=2 Tax=Xaviernesmea oryzae TaxID=464029 RepID=A0A1Q9ATZ7_9HYPH|nr:hypothetical protein BJF93_18220 [Xaviernesmea oryzae]
MSIVEKACPVVYRRRGGKIELLAFCHPLAGKQFVKGTIEPGEAPLRAAARELWEESGLTMQSDPIDLGTCRIINCNTLWHVFAWRADDLPEAWHHDTQDDGGQRFSFFWHPLESQLDDDWHPIFHEAYAFIALRLPRG